MAKKTLLHRPANFTRGDVEHAAQSAREMVVEDAVLQHLVNFQVIARRIYMVARSALDNEIRNGWDVDDPDLIIQTLVASCENKANEKFKILELQQSVLLEIIPVLDIFVKQAQDTGHDIDEEEPTSKENDGSQPDTECDVSGGNPPGEVGGEGDSPRAETG